jgi:hypothetical protein
MATERSAHMLFWFTMITWRNFARREIINVLMNVHETRNVRLQAVCYRVLRYNSDWRGGNILTHLWILRFWNQTVCSFFYVRRFSELLRTWEVQYLESLSRCCGLLATSYLRPVISADITRLLAMKLESPSVNGGGDILNFSRFYIGRGSRWLRHWAASRRFAGPIPNGIIGISCWLNPCGHTMALGLTQPLTELSTRDVSWG